MRETFRKSMTWLHTWSGLVFCWVLYFMFITGTLGYFDSEIDHWMMPEVQLESNKSLEDGLSSAQHFLQKNAPDAQSWGIGPVSDRERPHLFVNWQVKEGEGDEEHIHSESAEIWVDGSDVVDKSIRDTGGGQLLYRMHYLLHYMDRDIAFRLIGIITLIMFISLITGVVVHRKIFTDFFTFRPKKKTKAWLDMHNLLSVSSLPFQLMITYSGLIFVITTWLPLVALGSYGFDTQKTQSELAKILNRPIIERSGEQASMIDLSTLSQKIEGYAQPEQVSFIQIFAPNDTNARIYVTVKDGLQSRGGYQLVFDGVTGETLEQNPAIENTAVSSALVMIDLHEGLFAGPFLRWLYFLAGLVGAAMIATGAIYWVKKREIKQTLSSEFGSNLVQTLNIGSIIGLPIAVCGYFLANRLLPLELESRAQWEVHSMFIIWGLCFAYPMFRDKRKAWQELCVVAAVLFSSLPLINYLTTELHLVHTLSTSNWQAASVDIVILLFAGVFACAARVIANNHKTVIKRQN